MATDSEKESGWLRIAPVEQLADGSAAQLDLDGERIAIFRQAKELFALGAECLHMGGPLNEGSVEAGVVTCPWHGWRYELRSGDRLDRVGSPLPTFPVRVRDGWIELKACPAAEGCRSAPAGQDPAGAER